MYLFARRVLLVTVFILTSWFGLTALHNYLDPNISNGIDRSEEAKWVATSKHRLDRWACKWIGLCGLAHFHPDPATRSWKHRQYARGQDTMGEEKSGQGFDWESLKSKGRKMRPEDWRGDSRVLTEVPQFVLDHAPLIHLYSQETFWPSDIAEHLQNMAPYLNHTLLSGSKSQHGVTDLDWLNKGRLPEELFLHSKEDVEERPDWLSSSYNRPVPYDDEGDDAEEIERLYTSANISDLTMSEEEIKDWSDPLATSTPKIATPLKDSSKAQSPLQRRTSRARGNPRNHKRAPYLPRPAGYSPAPAFLVLVDKGNGILDAFWFYFYSYNLGTTVLKIRFGNHIGDWEHSLIRFHNGKPKAVFFSAHSGGLAYSYDAVEKGKGEGREGRPILYSAKGSHAMYATPGTHPYILPFGLLADVADKGPLWDPALNYIAYHMNTSLTHGADAYSPISEVPNTPSAHQVEFSIQPALDNPDAPLGWWMFAGHWGDKFYTLGDLRQWRFVGQYHYVNGPYGPRWKNLGRSKVCQSHGSCTILKSLDGDGKRDWLGKRSIDKLGL